MSRFFEFAQSDWAPSLKNAAYRMAPIVAVIITAMIMTYEAGARLRVTLDWANDGLAALWATAWGVDDASHAQRVDDFLLDTCMTAGMVWNWLTAAVAAPPLTPPPIRPLPTPAPEPMKRGVRK